MEDRNSIANRKALEERIRRMREDIKAIQTDIDQQQRETAQQASTQAARQQAEDIIQRAREEAQSLRESAVRAGTEDAIRRRDELQRENAEIQRRIEELQAQKDSLINELSGVSANLSAILGDSQPAAAAPAEAVPAAEDMAAIKNQRRQEMRNKAEMRVPRADAEPAVEPPAAPEPVAPAEPEAPAVSEPAAPAVPEPVEALILDELDFKPVEEETAVPVDVIPEPVATPDEDAEIIELRDKMAQLEKELAGMTEPETSAEFSIPLEPQQLGEPEFQEMIEEMSESAEAAEEAAPEMTAAEKAAAAAAAAAAVAAPALAAKAAEGKPEEIQAEVPADEPVRPKTNKELREEFNKREKEKREQEKREKAERKAQKKRAKAERKNKSNKAVPEEPKAAAEAVAETPAEAAETPAKAKKKHGVLKGILIALAILALIGVLVFELLLGIVHVQDDAMAGSLSKGSYLLYSRLDKLPSTNELVVFKNAGGKTCVRRMIARGGDTVTFDEFANQIEVNKKAIPNVPEDVDWWGIDRDFDFPITVQKNQVFVLSGNREDASNEGLIDKDSIKGKAIWIF